MAIKIPNNPITIAANVALIRSYLNQFMEQFLPNYIFRETSAYRDVKTNKEAGGVENSAHLYGLALDGNLIRKATGEIIDEKLGKKIFNDYFKPYFKGVSLFEKSSDGENWHIHLHLPRTITEYTKWAGYAGLAAGVAYVANKFIQKKKG